MKENFLSELFLRLTAEKRNYGSNTFLVEVPSTVLPSEVQMYFWEHQYQCGVKALAKRVTHDHFQLDNAGNVTQSYGMKILLLPA